MRYKYDEYYKYFFVIAEILGLREDDVGIDRKGRGSVT